MKNMSKYVTGLAVLGFVTVVAVPGHAAFSSKGTTSLTATAAVGGTATVAISSITILSRATNSPVTTITWTGATPGAGWLVADDYIQMATNINTSDGGVQIYTDNTNTGANPKYSGAISSVTATPAGLVDTVDTTQKLPTAWRGSTTTVASITGSNPNSTTDPNAPLWLFHEDHAQVAVPSLNAANFVNGDPFVTVYASPGTPLTEPNGTVVTTTASNSGLHFAQGPTQFGGFTANATTDIYTEADFTTALQGTTYSTNRLVLEAFSL